MVPVSMPQLIPVSSIQNSTSISFPQVVPTSSNLPIASSGVPLQILSSAPAVSGVAQSSVRINQLRPVQSPSSSMAPAVQLLNPGIIQLSPTSQGGLLFGGSPYLSVQQGKLILTIPAGLQLTSMPLKPVPDTAPPLDQTANALTPESMLTLSPMYSGVTTNVQLSQPAWSPVPLSTSASLAMFDVRGKGDLAVDPALLGLTGGESLLLESPTPEQDGEASSPLANPEDGDSKILTQLQSVPVDDELGL
ncbi:hypothetical protein OJAV_G00130210 [Oryzias javanicus]|uniref:Uncharacterized protein n=1 Tax=Oryzias javanicus TaxID=123683 RepID=A0A3S2MD84_ORYJA|nr:hypothetical protein OJAV_G00130210 [Oryzias javanicus]